MQSILREKLMAQMEKLARVSDVYRTQSHLFVEAYFSWLQEAEKDLSTLRSPISILLQAEKSSLVSVIDGSLPDHIQGGRSTRRSQRAAAAQSLERISKEVYSKIEDIDRNLSQANEQLCNAVAVLVTKEPDITNGLQPDQAGLNAIWKGLSRTPETRPMYHYLSAKLAPSDRDYLLIDIIQKLITNKVQ